MSNNTKKAQKAQGRFFQIPDKAKAWAKKKDAEIKRLYPNLKSTTESEALDEYAAWARDCAIDIRYGRTPPDFFTVGELRGRWGWGDSRVNTFIKAMENFFAEMHQFLVIVDASKKARKVRLEALQKQKSKQKEKMPSKIDLLTQEVLATQEEIFNIKQNLEKRVA